MPPGAADDRAFPPTQWSRILAGSGRRDLEALARSYWRPIHAFLRARLRVSDDDARELTQEAFAWMLARQLFDRADPARGRFRAFLKTALANFAIEQQRRAAAQKRGGGALPVPLDDQEVVDAAARTPDQLLDEAWRRELLERAQAQLEQELRAGGRERHWQLFADYFLADDDVDHAALASRHGVSKVDVSNWLDHAKKRYRALLRQLVADTVADADELQQELRWLFGPGGT